MEENGMKPVGAIHVGWHLSAAGGLLSMGRTALAAGADTFAYFTRNPRGGQAKPIEAEDAAALSSLLAEHSFAPLVVHAPYTLNVCSDKESVREFSVRTLADDIARAELVPGQLYNFHPGSHMRQGVDAGIEMISAALNSVLTEGQTTTVLLETMAGKGSEVGSSFGEIRRILDGVRLGGKVGVCLDTCHVHDAGYDIAGDLDGVLAEFDREVGLSRLRAVHLNDSMNARGSRKDRHQRIGAGEIGLEAFRRIVRHPALRGLPFILETPQNSVEAYAEEIALVRSLAAD